MVARAALHPFLGFVERRTQSAVTGSYRSLTHLWAMAGVTLVHSMNRRRHRASLEVLAEFDRFTLSRYTSQAGTQPHRRLARNVLSCSQAAGVL